MRPTIAEISLADVAWNVNEIRNLAPNTMIMGVVKANAYGHGIVEMARALKKAGVEFLAVAFAEEGVELRRAGVEGPIFVLIPPFTDDINLFLEYDLQLSVQSIDVIKAYNEAARLAGKKIDAHLFIDSGMRREGILPEDAANFMIQMKQLESINFVGICTHFAAPEESSEFMNHQIDEFNKALDDLKNNGFTFKYIHASNSASIALYPDARYNMVRPGLALYGLMPDRRIAEKTKLRPVLRLKSKVLAVKKLKKGETTGYALKYIVPEDTRIAIVPIGYGDGFYRLLTNKGKVIIRNKIYSIVGTVCMDQIMVNIGNDHIEREDEAILIGSSNDCNLEAYDIADAIGTIPYEVLTLIKKRVPRVYNS